ncbi:MAG: glutamine--tRNA ligase/YqeY domain fusion protein [Gemmatimonadota bacterium]|jgi:glutaminyl-tRNA synthetase|nr:glutamine--tRNA ligase/YqeY domain fusion protein [Gemmatimonadota bacterium]
MGDSGPVQGRDFVRAIVADDLKTDRTGGRLVTRFPPEPNGFLHIGHAASICLNFGIAAENGGVCHLRFDDTNPETEEVHFVDAIINDVRWLGFDWGDHLYFASDYFPRMYEYAEHLIREGRAYVDSLNEEQIREYRGTVMEPGRPGPYRDRTVEENLDLFRRMRKGEFPDGAHVLRARLDLASPNMRLRDPVIYRIRHAHHYRTGDSWPIYPLYDFAHPIEDAIECITHSICTLEFVESRPFYDWVVENIPRDQPGDGFSIPAWSQPHQYEFARRNLDYTVMSKRKLLQLVREKLVRGWDDPRMPTIAGIRRRGFTPSSIRAFAELIGVGKTENRTDIGKLEFAIRDELNYSAPRVLAVLRPLKVVLTNYPEGEVEEFDAPYFPRDIGREGSRMVPFSRELYIDGSDFEEDPPAGYHRLAPGREVRLRYGPVIRCDEVVRDHAGGITGLRCSVVSPGGGAAPSTGETAEEKSGGSRPARGSVGTIHWVSAAHAVPAEVRLYDRLFSVPDPDEGEGDFKDSLNPESLVVVETALVEPSVARDPVEMRYQFERLGYFWRDPVDSSPDRLVFNRIVTLRDAWTKQAESPSAPASSATGTGSAGGQGGASAGKAPSRPDAGGKGDWRGGEEKRAEPSRSPELEARRERYVKELGVGEVEAEVITRSDSSVSFFEVAQGSGAAPRLVANWMVHDLQREAGDRDLDELPFTGTEFGSLVALVDNATLSSSAARQVLAAMAATGETPEVIVERLGLRQISEPVVLEPLVRVVIERFPGKVAEYRGGRAGLLGFFVGRVMEMEGRANPEVVKRLIQEGLAGE